MKEYVKPSVQVIDMKVKDNVTAAIKRNNGKAFTVDGNKITYYDLANDTSGEVF